MVCGSEDGDVLGTEFPAQDAYPYQSQCELLARRSFWQHLTWLYTKDVSGRRLVILVMVYAVVLGCVMAGLKPVPDVVTMWRQCYGLGLSSQPAHWLWPWLGSVTVYVAVSAYYGGVRPWLWASALALAVNSWLMLQLGLAVTILVATAWF